ncbi:MAG TPA: hypothetical protein VFO79_00215 [Xanthomonadales bacterium]|nr:hypothetical protein [Xanthomonadales bacterium]
MAHETQPPKEPRDDRREAALASLPWLVNGTLSGDEAAAARAAIGTDLEARRMHRELEALAAIVRSAPLLDANAGLGFERLRAALDDGEAPRLDRNWARPTRPRPIPPQPARLRHLGLALAAGVLLAVFTIELAREPSLAPDYRTLTTAPASSGLRVVFDAALDAEGIDAVLARHGARRIGPVGANNVVQVDAGDPAALAEALAREPAVRLVGAATR